MLATFFVPTAIVGNRWQSRSISIPILLIRMHFLLFPYFFAYYTVKILPPLQPHLSSGPMKVCVSCGSRCISTIRKQVSIPPICVLLISGGYTQFFLCINSRARPQTCLDRSDVHKSAQPSLTQAGNSQGQRKKGHKNPH